MSPAKKRVVVTDLRFEGLVHERAAAERHGASFQEFDCHDEAGVVEALRDADIAFVNLVPVTEAALAGLRADGLVVRYGIGTDNVDVDAARRLGIRVANVPDYGSDTVADHASASMLALLRRLPMFDAAIRRDGWINPDTVGHLPALSATTVGLVGVGRIGLLVARRLQAFGIRILATDPFADADALRAANIDPVSLETLLGEAHGISLHLPATPATRHIIGPASIGRMRHGAMLVNTARGALVDETALAEALGDGRLGGAALDVFDPEPLAPNSPLRTLTNVILTPHAAFYSVQSLEALQRLASEEAARALAGEPLRSRIA